jgi:hypothetical protein
MGAARSQPSVERPAACLAVRATGLQQLWLHRSMEEALCTGHAQAPCLWLELVVCACAARQPVVQVMGRWHRCCAGCCWCAVGDSKGARGLPVGPHGVVAELLCSGRLAWLLLRLCKLWQAAPECDRCCAFGMQVHATGKNVVCNTTRLWWVEQGATTRTGANNNREESTSDPAEVGGQRTCCMLHSMGETEAGQYVSWLVTVWMVQKVSQLGCARMGSGRWYRVVHMCTSIALAPLWCYM